ncbi:hemicentin-2 [Ixodes scapularis]
MRSSSSKYSSASSGGLHLELILEAAILFVAALLSWSCGVAAAHLKGTSKRLIVREGHQTELPCDLRSASSNDSLAVVHWYHQPEKSYHATPGIETGPHHRGSSQEPIYTVDFGSDPSLTADAATVHEYGTGRGNNLLQVNRTAGQGWVGRAYFSIIGHPASLKVNSVRFEDAGVYTCTAVFRDGARRNSTVRLHVLAPPEPPVISDGEGHELHGIIGPYNEASMLALVCAVYGGKPKPTLVWSGIPEGMMAEIRSTSEEQLTTSTLLIHVLRRQDIGATLMCTASNNISSPASTSVTLDLNLRPIAVRIRREESPISAGLPAEIVCEVWGSRPPPVVTWWKGLQQLNHTFVYVSTDGNVTTSVVSFTPASEDHGSNLACRAKNPAMAESVEEDTWRMDVQYKPVISLQLGTNLDPEKIQENSDVYLECHVDAYPAVDEVSWQFSGQDLLASENLIISKTFLVIQRVQRHHSGFYSCSAENTLGRTQGENLQLRVQHAPLCREKQTVVYAASRHQEVEVHCDVEADPSNVTFEWRFNSTLQNRTVKSFTNHGTRSVAHYIPHGRTEFGTLLCFASNRIGQQKIPCVFHIVQAGPPGPVENCSITNQTKVSIHLECQAGSDGYLQALFQLSVYEAATAALLANFTADRPDFWVHDLRPGVEYFLVVWAANELGRSQELTILTPIMPLVGKLTKPGNTLKVTSSVLLLTVISSVALLCLVPVLVLAVVMLKGKSLPITRHETKKDVVVDDACPSTAMATPEEAMQLQISSIYPKEDNQVWIVKTSTGL